MTDSGLSTRLKQQSRRAGLMVGITMALAIAICVFGAALLFAWLSQPFSDLIPMVAPAAERPAAREAAEPPTDGEAVAVEQATQADPEPTAAPENVPTIAAADETFAPTHQIAPGDSVNFRAGPSRSDAVIVALSPATPLEYLGEDAPTENPSDGDRWMKFRNENGDEGWVREIDTEPYVP
jgi:hypothetical protein